MPNTQQETLAASQAIRKMIEHFGGDVAGHLTPLSGQAQINARFHFLDAGAFQVNLMTSPRSRGTGCTAAFTETLHGQPEIYVRRDMASPGTLVHELIHFCMHSAFEQHFTNDFMEGLTEYFTRQVYKITRQSYPRECAFVESVVEIMGDDGDARAALFRGDMQAMDRVDVAISFVAPNPPPGQLPGRAQQWTRSPRAGVPRNPRIQIGRGGPGGRRA